MSSSKQQSSKGVSDKSVGNKNADSQVYNFNTNPDNSVGFGGFGSPQYEANPNALNFASQGPYLESTQKTPPSQFGSIQTTPVVAEPVVAGTGT